MHLTTFFCLCLTQFCVSLYPQVSLPSDCLGCMHIWRSTMWTSHSSHSTGMYGCLYVCFFIGMSRRHELSTPPSYCRLLTIYVDCCPAETVFRIWDTFLYEQDKVLWEICLRDCYGLCGTNTWCVNPYFCPISGHFPLCSWHAEDARK